jgi:putative ABC transport system ATP-binding protein
MVNDNTVIQLSGISKAFETDEVRTHAVSEVSLSIVRGEYIAISGPSGCGKSTLLSILGLLDTPTAGEYRLNGVAVTDLSPRTRAQTRNRQIGFIFQSFNLLGDRTVAENVELPLTYRSMSAADRKRQVDHALARVDMTQRARHYPAQLSGGQQQRVAVARAVAGDPAILLADEPTGNLDSKTGVEIMGVFERLHSAGNTIVLVTHEPEIAAYAHRTISIRDGLVEKDARRGEVAAVAAH